MTVLPFTDWLPDQASLNAPFVSDVQNVLCAAGFYIPFPLLASFSEAVDEAPLGGITIRESDGSVHIFIGTATKLYKLNTTTLGWDHVSKLAANQATNGTFSADTDWTKSAGTTIAAGVATLTNVATATAALAQAQTVTAGTVYKIVFTVSGYTEGAIRPRFTGGTAVDGTSVSADGTSTQYLTAVTGNTTFNFITTGETSLNIDNVTIQALTNYSATVDERWRFKQFGDFVVAVNINTAPQVYEIGTSTEFTDLGGSPPNSRHIAVWGDHLALMSERTVTWSDTDDITEWATGNAGSQTFPDGGVIQGSNDATNPIVIQKDAIRLGTFVPGSTVVFTFTKIHDKRGAAAPYSITSRGEYTFFADTGGFFRITPDGAIQSIGFEKVDRTIFGLIGGSELVSIYGEVDPFHTRVYFAVKINSTSDAFDRLVIYDWNLDKWTQIETEMEILFPLASGTIGYTLEGLDEISASLDALPFSLDSKVWQGGSPVMAAFDTSNMLGFFSGNNAEAIVTTQEVGATDGQLTMISSLYPVVDTDDVKVTIAARMKRGDTFTSTPELTPSTVTGRVDKLNTSRFHRFRVRIPAETVWSAAQGIDVETQPAGYR